MFETIHTFVPRMRILYLLLILKFSCKFTAETFNLEKKLFLRVAFFDPCRACGALYEPFKKNSNKGDCKD